MEEGEIAEIYDLPPVRCLECGKVLANKYGQFVDLRAQGVPPAEIFERLGLSRYCCRQNLANPYHIPHRKISKEPTITEEARKRFPSWIKARSSKLSDYNVEVEPDVAPSRIRSLATLQEDTGKGEEIG